jgi:hypothetical protein
MTKNEEIVAALTERNYARVAELAKSDRRVLTRLMGMAFNKEDVLAWRAIEAMGVCAQSLARLHPERMRNLAQRILWSAREESGGMGWSAPELLAEIASASPKRFADIPPIIVSLHSEDEEKVFLKGVLWAIARMAKAGIREIPGAEELVAASLEDRDDQIRGMAVIAATQAGMETLSPEIRKLADDSARFTIYMDGNFAEVTIAEAVAGMSLSAAGGPPATK